MTVHKTTHLNYNSTADPAIHFHQPAVKIQLCIPAQLLAPNSHRPESLFRVTKVRFITFQPIYRTYKNTQNVRENIFCIALSCDLTDFMVNLTKRLLFIKNVLAMGGHFPINLRFLQSLIDNLSAFTSKPSRK